MPPVKVHKQLREAAALRGALRGFLRASDRLTRAAGLTTQRYELLLVATTAPGGRATLTEIAQRLALAPSSASELVNRSEARGLVRRELSAENRRVTYVAATKEGERRVTKAAAALSTERQSLVSLLAELRR